MVSWARLFFETTGACCFSFAGQKGEEKPGSTLLCLLCRVQCGSSRGLLQWESACACSAVHVALPSRTIVQLISWALQFVTCLCVFFKKNRIIVQSWVYLFISLMWFTL